MRTEYIPESPMPTVAENDFNAGHLIQPRYSRSEINSVTMGVTTSGFNCDYQGSEWSAEDRTGLASQAESQV